MTPRFVHDRNSEREAQSHIFPPLQVFRFIGSKSESLFLQRKNPRKISWTVVYRRMHKKGLAEEVAKKRTRKNVKAQVRARLLNAHVDERLT